MDDFCLQSFPVFAEFFKAIGTDTGDDLTEFAGQLVIGFGTGRPTVAEEIPDGNGEFAGDGGGDEVGRAFAGQESFTPLGQRMGGAQEGLGTFEQEAAQIAPAPAREAAVPVVATAVVEGRGEADIADELAWVGKTTDVADQGTEGEGDDLADAAEPDQSQQLWVLEDFLGDEAAPVGALFVGVAQFEQEAGEHLPLARGPVAGRAQVGRDLLVGGQWRAGLEPHAIVTEVGEDAVADLGGAFDGFAMGMEPIAAFLGLGVGDPDGFGRAGQPGFADADGADLIVVGVGLFEFAEVAAFQDVGLS